MVRAITLACVIAVAAGCATDKVRLPKTELPEKPISMQTTCEDLSTTEEMACLQTGPDARNVCRKAQRNKIICDDRGNFIDRLYSARDGK